MKCLARIGYCCVCFLLLTIVNLSLLPAQSGTSSAISGTVTDTSGAVVSRALVTATEVNTKAERTGRTDANGHYLFSQVNPGTYRVEVQAAGFAEAGSQPTPVGVGRNVALNFTLRIGSLTQTVEVTARQGLLTLDNPNTTTTIEAQSIKNLPNPGQDLTYVAQFAQGALMNTAGSSSDAKAPGGYGNVEFNGLPATSNGYILDGYDSNDPWLGLNIGLSTNLVTGLDALQESTVNTNSFSVDQGRYGASQVNYTTTTGRFAGMRANPAANTRQRVGIAGKLVCFLKSPFRNERDVPARVRMGRTSHHAGEVGVQPIPVHFFVFEPLQQDGSPEHSFNGKPFYSKMVGSGRGRPLLVFLFAQSEVCFAVARHSDRLGLVLGAFMPRGYGVAAVGNILDFVGA